MHEFFEESFDIEKSYEYILSIQVSLDGFSFSIVRSSDNKLLIFKCNSLTISSESQVARRFKEWVMAESVLQKTFKKVRIIVFSNNFTLVPKQLYNFNTNEELTRILFEEGDKLQWADNLVQCINAKLLFAFPDGLAHSIKETIGECEIIHPLKLIIGHSPKNLDEKVVTLLFDGGNVYFVLFENGNLLMANNFKINHANDAVYFVLTALKQLNIHSSEIKLFYSGKSEHLEEATSILESYFISRQKLGSSYSLTDNTIISEELLAQNITLFL